MFKDLVVYVRMCVRDMFLPLPLHAASESMPACMQACKHTQILPAYKLCAKTCAMYILNQQTNDNMVRAYLLALSCQSILRYHHGIMVR